MDAELRQVANGFDYKVHSFDKHDINGYRFRTYGKELSMADRKSTNSCSLLSAKEIPSIMEELNQFMNFNSMVQTHQTS